MNFVHISNDFAGSKVYSIQTEELDGLGINQAVYCLVRENRQLGKNQFKGINVQFVYSFYLVRERRVAV